MPANNATVLVKSSVYFIVNKRNSPNPKNKKAKNNIMYFILNKQNAR
jgi:hypothetical protein